jgi:murein DD-endopeptidase MepM/ murein hydrolase activator NlpD
MLERPIGMVVRIVAAALAIGVLAALVPARAATPVADGFDFPVGPPDATGYYDAQPFGDNDHLGSDWNGAGGGNSDLGDPVHAIGDGVVTAAEDLGGGWGKVVRICHRIRDRGEVREIESLYAHLDAIDVVVGAAVRRGDTIGTIGTAGGRYRAHLHLELRTEPGLPVGGGYGTDRSRHLDPTAFIRAHRP